VGQARTHLNIGIVLDRQGDHAQGLTHSLAALSLYRAEGHLAGQADALNAVGWFHTLLGEHEQALAYCRQALTVYQQVGDHLGQAASWDSIGHAHHHLGRHAEAVTCYLHSVSLNRDLGARYHEAAALTALGDTYQATADRTGAREAWRQALAILDDLDHTEAAQVRAKLAALDGASR
jgi:tetratricopeptide (TPR) repeat protein